MLYNFSIQAEEQKQEIGYLKELNQELSEKYCKHKALSDNLNTKISFYISETETIPSYKSEIEVYKQTIKDLNEKMKDFQIRNDDQELRIVGMIKAEKRLLELLKSTKSYNDVALIPFAKSDTVKTKKAKTTTRR